MCEDFDQHSSSDRRQQRKGSHPFVVFSEIATYRLLTHLLLTEELVLVAAGDHAIPTKVVIFWCLLTWFLTLVVHPPLV